MPKRRLFLDKLRLFCKGGIGGAGYPKNNGKGGDGGDVIFSARHRYRMADVLRKHPTKRVIAHAGKPSTRYLIIGQKGHDINIVCPEGVEVRLDDGTILGDLNQEGDRIVVAKGGKGGGPTNGFFPQPGQARSVTMDLKLIADVGLVGFPNAGKSTLLSSVSRTQPKIAEYPFTTLVPMIATMDYVDGRQITMADLPGLIEGAHVNVGLGHHFLKHVERTKCLLFVLDVMGFRFKPESPYRSIEETALLLNRELERYKTPLNQKPAICVVNKRDLVEDQRDVMEEVLDNLRNLPSFAASCRDLEEDVLPEEVIQFNEVIEVSAKNSDNTDHLKDRLRHWLDEFEIVEQREALEKAEGKMLNEMSKSSVETFDSIV